jgi:hypothetical protein
MEKFGGMRMTGRVSVRTATKRSELVRGRVSGLFVSGQILAHVVRRFARRPPRARFWIPPRSLIISAMPFWWARTKSVSPTEHY